MIWWPPPGPQRKPATLPDLSPKGQFLHFQSQIELKFIHPFFSPLFYPSSSFFFSPSTFFLILFIFFLFITGANIYGALLQARSCDKPLPALYHLILISTYKVGTIIITVLEISKEKVREIKWSHGKQVAGSEFGEGISEPRHGGLDLVIGPRVPPENRK